MVTAMSEASVGNARIAYRLDGPDGAPVLVLSHSLGTEMAMWEPQVAALAAQWRVLRYDARGHGRSSVPPGPYTIAELGADVVGLLDHLGVPRAHFCGLSMGGMTGIWLGAHAPSRIDRLVLGNTAMRIGTPQSWDARIARLREGGMSAIADAVVARWFSAAFDADHPQVMDQARRMLLSTPDDGYAAACAAVRDADLSADLARIAAPTLVIAGSQDESTPPAEGRALAERIATARFVELPAGHISNLERPAAFTRTLVDFLHG
jgi:3-oxoadipate enol-lactonase